MYFRALLFERVFSCCAKCIAVADILKMPLLPPVLADLAPSTLCRPRDPQQGEPRPLCSWLCVHPQQGERTRARFARGFVAWSVCQCSQGVPAPLKFYAKVLLFSHICKYICIKICSIGEFCVAPFVSLQNTFQYSEFSLYFKYPFPRHTHFCPI